jgi:hypothetical protein
VSTTAAGTVDTVEHVLERGAHGSSLALNTSSSPVKKDTLDAACTVVAITV